MGCNTMQALPIFPCMSTLCTFLPALAVEAIGADRPTFPQKLLVVLADHYWDISRQDDGRYVVRCSREAPLYIARLLQTADRSACIEGTALIVSELRRSE